MSSSSSSRFDGLYYNRFYGRHGAHDRRRVSHLATGVHHLAAWWGIPISSVLDVGAGVGMWRDWYRSEHPRVRVTSVDISDHACTTWGHEKRDIAEWTPPRAFDLVVCHSVLQYLDNRAATAAIENLAAGSRHLLYLEAPTSFDLQNLVDESATDMDVHRRSAQWYKTRLRRHFQQVGAGLWIRTGSTVMYELEAADRR